MKTKNSNATDEAHEENMAKRRVKIDEDMAAAGFGNEVPVLSAYLHQALIAPGISSPGNALNQSKLPGIKMTWVKDLKAIKINYKKREIWLPCTNFGYWEVDAT